MYPTQYPSEQVGRPDAYGALLWLHHSNDVNAIVQALQHHRQELGIQKIWYGKTLDHHFGVTASDNRIPDIMIQTSPGVIYIKLGDHKLAEHGGWSIADRHVALLVSNPGLPDQGKKVNSETSTMQVAPTILSALGINPNALEAVAQNHIQPLPFLGLNSSLDPAHSHP